MSSTTTTPTPTATTTTRTATPTATTNPSVDQARGKLVTVSSVGDVYGGGNPTDGNATTYWESAANAFPATATVDFGTAVPSLATVTLRLPPSTAWAARSETLSILTSTDGSSWTTVTASAGHRFDPATGNVVSIPIAATTARYIRVSITGNTGWGAGQLSELEVYQG